MKRIFYLFAVVFFGLSNWPRYEAKVPPVDCTIYGSVLRDKKPLPNATVMLSGKNLQVQVKVRQDGDYCLTDKKIGKGKYRMTVLMPDTPKAYNYDIRIKKIPVIKNFEYGSDSR